MSSTPISKLPINNPNLQITGDSQEDDPEVQAVLQEVNEQQQHHQAQPVYRPAPPAYRQPQAPVNYKAPAHIESMEQSQWLNSELAKKAIIAAIIAGIMFYPKTLTLLYEKVPMISKFESYDLFIRIALLAVVLYVLMWKLNL
jgi:hypothetical protein